MLDVMEAQASRTPRPARGTELELVIDSLAFGGAGVARLDGYVVFVSDAMPGDRVRAVVGKSKRAYAEARAVEILEPGPERIAPGWAATGAIRWTVAYRGVPYGPTVVGGYVLVGTDLGTLIAIGGSAQ